MQFNNYYCFKNMVQLYLWNIYGKLKSTLMNEWMNDAFIKRFIVYGFTHKALYNHVGGASLMSFLFKL